MQTASKRRVFGAALRNLRKRHGLTLRGLGDGAKIPFACIGMIEAGQRAIGPDHAAKIANFLSLKAGERDEFLQQALETVAARGRNRVSTACPPHLAQLFGQHLTLLLGAELADIEAVGCFVFPSRKLHFVCERGAKLTTLKSSALKYINSQNPPRTLFVIFLRNGIQTVVECDAKTF